MKLNGLALFLGSALAIASESSRADTVTDPFETHFDSFTQQKIDQGPSALSALRANGLGAAAGAVCYLEGSKKVSAAAIAAGEELEFTKRYFQETIGPSRAKLVQKILEDQERTIDRILDADNRDIPANIFEKSAYARSRILEREVPQAEARLKDLTALYETKAQALKDAAAIGKDFDKVLPHLVGNPSEKTSEFVVSVKKLAGLSEAPCSGESCPILKTDSHHASVNAQSSGAKPLHGASKLSPASVSLLTDAMNSGSVEGSKWAKGLAFILLHENLPELTRLMDETASVGKEVAAQEKALESLHNRQKTILQELASERSAKTKVISAMLRDPDSDFVKGVAPKQVRGLKAHMERAMTGDTPGVLARTEKARSGMRNAGRALQIGGALFFFWEMTDLSINICNAMTGNELSYSPMASTLLGDGLGSGAAHSERGSKPSDSDSLKAGVPTSDPAATGSARGTRLE